VSSLSQARRISAGPNNCTKPPSGWSKLNVDGPLHPCVLDALNRMYYPRLLQRLQKIPRHGHRQKKFSLVYKTGLIIVEASVLQPISPSDFALH
jgi:hypothetical protein